MARFMKVLDLKQTFRWFKEHHEEIFRQYSNCYVVLQGESVLFSANTYDEALERANEEGLRPGTYLIQECSEGESAYTQMFCSNIVFA